MFALFSKPYRRAGQGIASVWRALAFGAFVFLFLALFRPFGLAEMDNRLWRVALGYGVVCTACMLLLNGLVPKLAARWFAETGWTVGREIGWTLLNLAMIGMANWLYSTAIGLVPPGFGAFVLFAGYTLLVGAFPVVVVVLLREARLTKRYHERSMQINAGLAQQAAEAVSMPTAPPTTTVEDRMITIPSEQGKEDLMMPAGDLLFIRSSANYLEVHYRERGQLRRKVIRGSLKEVEARLAAMPGMLRCHKSHLVNLDRVVRVSGNAQGFRLQLDLGGEDIPVSRSLNARLPGLVAVRP